MTTLLFFICFLVHGVAGGDPKKSAAVDMVLKMLSDVATKVESEGEEEAKTFRKFDRFCSDTAEETKASIDAADTKIGTLSGNIKSLTAKNEQTTAEIDELVKGIAELKATVKDKAAERATASAEYKSNAKDLGKAIYSVEHSIDELKAKQSTSFLQQQSFKKTVQAAALLADSLGMKTSSLHGLDAEDTSYDGIVTMLEGLQTEFRSKRNAADTEEARAVNSFKMEDGARKIKLKHDEKTLREKRADLAQKTKEIGVAEQDLAETTAARNEDDAYSKETTASCINKRDLHDQHVAGREEELAALSQAKKIMENAMAPSANDAASSGDGSSKSLLLIDVTDVTTAATTNQDLLSAANAEASAVEQEERSAPPSLGFLQMQKVQEHQPSDDRLSEQRAVLVSLLSRSAKRLHSQQLAAIATKAGSDPFKAVKEMISGIITKTQKQMEADQSNKAACDKNIGAASAARDDASSAVTQLNVELASTEARRDELVEDTTELGDSLKALDTKEKELVKIRAEEASEAAETIAESKIALAGVKEATQVITDFYDKASKATVPKSSAPASLLQGAKPEDEAYTGKQGASKGIIGTLEVIQSDFERTISETEASERTAEKEHKTLLTDMGLSKAKKSKAKDFKNRFKEQADAEIAKGQESLSMETGKLKSALMQLKSLEASCGVGVTYEARKAARAEEMKALEEAISAIDGFSQ